MVATHCTGQLVRSMVRIPGSGSDRQANPSCLDLSNVSGLAAAVPLPQVLPRALIRPHQSSASATLKPNELARKLQPMNSGPFANNVNIVRPVQQEASARTLSQSTTERKRPRPQELPEGGRESRSSNPPAPKVARVTNAQGQSLQFQTLSRANQTAQVILQQPQPQQSPSILSSSLQTPQIATSAIPTILVQHNSFAVNTLQTPQVASSAMPTILVQHNLFAANTLQQNQLPVIQTGAVQMRILHNAGNIAVVVPQTVPVEQQSSANLPSQESSGVLEVLQEMNQLKQENKVLLQTLTKFQNVFKSKENLRHIARRLAETTTA